MPSLTVQSCLVCDDFREEAHGKSTLLGFFGSMPHVHIRIADISKPLASVTFVFLAASGGLGSGPGRLVIKKPSGSVLLDSGFKYRMSAGQENYNLVMKIVGTIFRENGLYDLALTLDGGVVFSSTFKVSEDVALRAGVDEAEPPTVIG